MLQSFVQFYFLTVTWVQFKQTVIYLETCQSFGKDNKFLVSKETVVLLLLESET